MIYKIKPYLINGKDMHKFYNELLENSYKIKIWDRSKDKGIYKYFLPSIRNYIFWTFDLKEKDKFKKMDLEMKSAICNNYPCTMFEKKDNKVITFNTGVIFVIGKVEDKILKGYTEDIEQINIDKEKIYELSTENDEELYNYIISLYKFVTLRRLEKLIDQKQLFDKTRKSFVKFIEEIYQKDITEDERGNELIEKWSKELKLDKIYISVENKFDLMYRNNRLDNKEIMLKIVIFLLIITIIIGMINLGNWLG